MSLTHTIKQGDTLPVITATLTGADGNPIDLTGASVKFNMRRRSTPVIDHGTCTIVGAATDGVVSYAWTAEDTANDGEYRAEFEITFGDNSILTVPNDSDITVTIVEQVA